jgi:hypothetical protein
MACGAVFLPSSLAAFWGRPEGLLFAVTVLEFDYF